MSSRKEQMIAKYKDPATIEKGVKEIFEKYDTNKNGYIEQSEFGNVLKFLSQTIELREASEKDIQEVMKSLDKNNDGKISPEEMKKMVQFYFNVRIMQLQGFE
ncbi:MAG: EF-hand domain-containing protein [archaeon]|nr:EF-hand domain-containing protein [archaeon]